MRDGEPTRRTRQRCFVMQHTIRAAIARFPDRGHAIETLARTDETFRSLCEDLDEAETALALWERSRAAIRIARCAEYRDLVRDLAAEIETALDVRQ
jgi:hypothetical protein